MRVLVMGMINDLESDVPGCVQFRKDGYLYYLLEDSCTRVAANQYELRFKDDNGNAVLVTCKFATNRQGEPCI
jgi:hypothetical protein